jgi:hypothetical protein
MMIVDPDAFASGAVSYLNWLPTARAAIVEEVTHWPTPTTATHALVLGDHIAIVLPSATRHLTKLEQRIFQRALRRSVKIIRSARMEA